MTETIGFMASIISLSAGFPQIIKSLKTRSTNDLSLATYLLSVSGSVMWLWYGLMISSNPIIWTNIVSLFINILILCLKLKYSSTR